MSRSVFQKATQVRSPELPGSGVSIGEQLRPGRAPVWSELEGKRKPGDSAKEHT
jgi:hypothetical protein